MKKLTKLYMLSLFIIGFLYAQEGKPKNEYQIEVINAVIDPKTNTLLKDGEIRFVFLPKKKIIKRIPIGRGGEEGIDGVIRAYPKDYRESDWQVVYLPPNKKYLIYFQEIPRKNEEGEKSKVKFSFINVKGERKWSKEFDVVFVFKEGFGKEGEFTYYFTISREGNRVLFVRALNNEGSEVSVFDTLGNLLSKSIIPPIFEGEIQISPDGKIVGAKIEQLIKNGKGLGRHLFFLDVETGRTKIVRAEGKGWRIAGFPLNEKKIELTLYEYPKSVILTFNELPDDLSTLFGGER